MVSFALRTLRFLFMTLLLGIVLVFLLSLFATVLGLLWPLFTEIPPV